MANPSPDETWGTHTGEVLCMFVASTIYGAVTGTSCQKAVKQLEGVGINATIHPQKQPRCSGTDVYMLLITEYLC